MGRTQGQQKRHERGGRVCAAVFVAHAEISAVLHARIAVVGDGGVELRERERVAGERER